MDFLPLPAYFRTVESVHSEVPMTSNLSASPQKSEIGDYEMHYYDMEKSGERIRQLRIQSGYTQEQLAGKLNIDQSYYGRIETGKRGCPVEIFVQLSDLFGVTLNFLILTSSDSDQGYEPSAAQVKSDIDNLMEHLEQFKATL